MSRRRSGPAAGDGSRADESLKSVLLPALGADQAVARTRSHGQGTSSTARRPRRARASHRAEAAPSPLPPAAPTGEPRRRTRPAAGRRRRRTRGRAAAGHSVERRSDLSRTSTTTAAPRTGPRACPPRRGHRQQHERAGGEAASAGVTPCWAPRTDRPPGRRTRPRARRRRTCTRGRVPERAHARLVVADAAQRHTEGRATPPARMPKPSRTTARTYQYRVPAGSAGRRPARPAHRDAEEPVRAPGDA